MFKSDPVDNKFPGAKFSIAVIGFGFSGLSAAAYLAKAGYSVNVYEKNSEIGGRSSQLVYNGYKAAHRSGFGSAPSIISGKVSAQLLIQHLNTNERTI